MAEKTNALARGNGFPPDVVKSLVSRTDAIDAEMDKLKEQHKAEMDSLKDDQKMILEDIKREHGIPVKASEHFLKKLALKRALENFDEDSDPAITHDADLLAIAFGWGNSPLGDFAEGQG